MNDENEVKRALGKIAQVESITRIGFEAKNLVYTTSSAINVANHLKTEIGGFFMETIKNAQECSKSKEDLITELNNLLDYFFNTMSICGEEREKAANDCKQFLDADDFDSIRKSLNDKIDGTVAKIVEGERSRVNADFCVGLYKFFSNAYYILFKLEKILDCNKDCRDETTLELGKLVLSMKKSIEEKNFAAFDSQLKLLEIQVIQPLEKNLEKETQKRNSHLFNIATNTLQIGLTGFRMYLLWDVASFGDKVLFSANGLLHTADAGINFYLAKLSHAEVGTFRFCLNNAKTQSMMLQSQLNALKKQL